MKINKLSLKYQIVLYIIVSSIAMIALLWIFQLFITPNIYQNVRTKSVKDLSDEIFVLTEKGDIDTNLTNLTQNKNVCALTVVNGKKFVVSSIASECILTKFTNNQIQHYYSKALNNNNEYLEIFSWENDKVHHNGVDVRSEKRVRSLIFAKIDPKTQQIVITNTLIMIQEDASETFSKVFIFLGAFLLLLAITVSFVVSQKISRPIKELSLKVKELAKGNYNVQFENQDNLELAELSDSLNFTAIELGKVDQQRKDILANLSHDFKTPLTMISSYSELMQDISNENTPENLQVIIDETNYLNHLVNDMLDLSKYENQQQVLTIEKFDINALILELVKNTEKIYQKKITTSLTNEVSVLGDKVKIRQVLINLLNNAQDYAVNKIVITSTVIGNEIKISVIDDGDGVSFGLQKHLWERYYRVNNEHSLHSGLGLAIVKDILNLHNYKFGVQSIELQGSEFFFFLPIKRK